MFLEEPTKQDLPSPCSPSFPTCTQALEEPVWALQAELFFPPGPHSEGRKGTVEREVPSSSGCVLWWGLVLPGFLLPVNQAWCHGAGGVLGPCPVPSSAVPSMLLRELANSVSPLSDLCWNHCCGAAQLCRCNQDHVGMI